MSDKGISRISIDETLTEGELQPTATVQEFFIVRQEGKRQVSHSVEHYNLEAISSVNCRANGASNHQPRATPWEPIQPNQH